MTTPAMRRAQFDLDGGTEGFLAKQGIVRIEFDSDSCENCKCRARHEPKS